MAIIVPILSTFDPKGINQAEKSFGGVAKQANLLKTAFAGIGIAAVAKGLQSSVLAASNLSESIAKSNTVFGKNAKVIEDWSKTTSKSLGVSQQAALEAAGTYGNLFRAFGIGEQDSAMMSKSLVTLAADLASFNNVPIDDALLALRSGLSGETEPLKRFGIAINEARLKEQALADGLIKTTKGTLPQAIKTQAAYALIMKDSALAQGDVARTSNGLANQLKFLKSGLEDAKAGFGQALLPVVLNVVTTFNDKLLPAIQTISKAFQFEGVDGGLRTLFTEIANVTTNATGMAKVIKDVVLALIGMKVAIIALRIAPPIIVSITSALQSMRIATLYGAAGFKMLAGTIKTALASTGIGLLVVGLGLVVGKLIDARLEASALDREVTVVVSNGETKWIRYGNAIYDNVTVQLNAASLAATRLDNDLDNAGVKFVKIRNQQGKAVYNPVKNPDDGSGITGTSKADKKAAEAAKKAAKAAADMAKVVASGTTRATAALTKMNDKLTEAKDKLTQAKAAFDTFRDGVQDSITGLLSFSDAAKSETGSFLDNLKKQADGIVAFSGKVQQLIASGLSESAIQQVLSAGAEAGTKIADELIAGGATAITETNKLVASVADAATQLAQSGANAFYQAGVTQGEAMVNGIIAAVKKAGFVISGGSVVLPTALQKALNAGSLSTAQVKQLNTLLSGVPQLADGGIVNKPTLALIGESGPEAVIPLSGRNSSAGNIINLTVNAGMGADGQVIGREIVDAIKRYERVSGPVFASA